MRAIVLSARRISVVHRMPYRRGASRALAGLVRPSKSEVPSQPADELLGPPDVGINGVRLEASPLGFGSEALQRLVQLGQRP